MPATARRTQLLQRLNKAVSTSGGGMTVGDFDKARATVAAAPAPDPVSTSALPQVSAQPVAPTSPQAQQLPEPQVAEETQPAQEAAPILTDEQQKLADFEAALEEAKAEAAALAAAAANIPTTQAVPTMQSAPDTQIPQASQVPQDSPIPVAEQPVEQSLPPVPNAVPAAVLASTPDPLNPPQAAIPVQRKEVQPEPIMAAEPAQPPTEVLPETSTLIDQAAVPEASAQEHGVPGVQAVEHEPKPEISPEISEYLQEVQNHQELQPHEVVIANQTPQVLPPKMLPKPVIVLPLTPEVEKVGQRKGVVWSVRWLVEWSQKIMKMFSGKVIYQEAK